MVQTGCRLQLHASYTALFLTAISFILAIHHSERPVSLCNIQRRKFSLAVTGSSNSKERHGTRKSEFSSGVTPLYCISKGGSGYLAGKCKIIF